MDVKIYMNFDIEFWIVLHCNTAGVAPIGKTE